MSKIILIRYIELGLSIIILVVLWIVFFVWTPLFLVYQWSNFRWFLVLYFIPFMLLVEIFIFKDRMHMKSSFRFFIYVFCAILLSTISINTSFISLSLILFPSKSWISLLLWIVQAIGIAYCFSRGAPPPKLLFEREKISIFIINDQVGVSLINVENFFLVQEDKIYIHKYLIVIATLQENTDNLLCLVLYYNYN
jgi:hypothetical protein